jgi:hypothetical protein
MTFQPLRLTLRTSTLRRIRTILCGLSLLLFVALLISWEFARNRPIGLWYKSTKTDLYQEYITFSDYYFFTIHNNRIELGHWRDPRLLSVIRQDWSLICNVSVPIATLAPTALNLSDQSSPCGKVRRPHVSSEPGFKQSPANHRQRFLVFKKPRFVPANHLFDVGLTLWHDHRILRELQQFVLNSNLSHCPIPSTL